MKINSDDIEKMDGTDHIKKVKRCQGMKAQINSLGKNIDSSSSGVQKYKYDERYNRASDNYRESC